MGQRMLCSIEVGCRYPTQPNRYECSGRACDVLVHIWLLSPDMNECCRVFQVTDLGLEA